MAHASNDYRSGLPVDTYESKKMRGRRRLSHAKKDRGEADLAKRADSI